VGKPIIGLACLLLGDVLTEDLPEGLVSRDPPARHDSTQRFHSTRWQPDVALLTIHHTTMITRSNLSRPLPYLTHATRQRSNDVLADAGNHGQGDE
jgi:hypothetical protein